DCTGHSVFHGAADGREPPDTRRRSQSDVYSSGCRGWCDSGSGSGDAASVRTPVATVTGASQASRPAPKDINYMNAAEQYDVIVLGSGTAGKLMAWTMPKEGCRTAVIERKYIGGSCPNIACLPSKNIIHSAKVASLVARHREFGIDTGPISIDMAGVYARKR